MCKKFARRKPAKPLLMRPMPGYSWLCVGVDLFQYVGKSYVVSFDAFLNYPEVQLQHTGSQTAILKLTAIFAWPGVPMHVCSDNRPQFTSTIITSKSGKKCHYYNHQHVREEEENARASACPHGLWAAALSLD